MGRDSIGSQEFAGHIYAPRQKSDQRITSICVGGKSTQFGESVKTTLRGDCEDFGEGYSAASSIILVGDLLHKTDDPAPQHGVLNPHERFGEANSIRHGEEVGHIGR
jgi:hypothetical protein